MTLIRIRDAEGGGFTVTLVDADGEKGSRHTDKLAEAFAWQKAGKIPAAPKHEPETNRGKKK